MKKSEREAIIKKLEDWNFQKVNGGYSYNLPFGLNNQLFVDEFDLEIGIIHFGYMPIRHIKSPEDLENLFNAICPEKYRLPFN